MKKNSIAEFELERQDFKIKLKRGVNGNIQTAQYEDAQTLPYIPTPLPLPAPGAPAPQAAVSAANEVEIKSPMIGTIYRAPSPEAGHYVDIGSEVNPETVVCIIEAMKVMNEIKAEARGIITQVCVENAKPVEFGQALFKIRPT